MNYLLAVLTHGRNERMMRQAIGSVLAHVTPEPAATIVHHDVESAGFCAATRELWAKAAASEHDYVFWLEHDFLLLRPVDLVQLASVLDANPKLAQMALMRDAYSDEEKAAGGLFEYRTPLGDFDQRRHYVYEDDLDAGDQMGAEITSYPWLAQSYLTTNPSLMRREFMWENPWPDYSERCEGLFTFDLRERGYEFGTWGSGEVWVNHIGQRDGSGHGY